MIVKFMCGGCDLWFLVVDAFENLVYTKFVANIIPELELEDWFRWVSAFHGGDRNKAYR